MSNGNKTKTSNGKVSNNDFKGFFNPVINKDIKTAVNSLNLADSSTVERIIFLSQSQLKLSIVADQSCTHFTFSLFDRRPESDSRGYVLSVKHSDFSKGIALLELLVSEIYQGTGWLPFIKGTDDIDW